MADNLVRDRDGTRTYDGDRIQSDEHGRRYRHDPSGRLVGIDTAADSRRLWFDARDRLRRVHTQDDRIVHHTYDALGRLSETVAEMPDGQVRREAYYWDGDSLARRVVHDHGDDVCMRDERYTFDPEQRMTPLLRSLAGPDGAQSVQYYTTDQRGAAVRLSDEKGAAIWGARYDPYGRCHEQGAEAGEQPVRMLGQVHDAGSALSHHRFRVYDPALARFVSPDPLGIQGGENAFAYPNDPISWVDPLGLAKCRMTGATENPDGTPLAASDLPLVRPGTRPWDQAVASMRQGGRGDVRVETATQARQMLQEARGNMDRRHQYTPDNYGKGYEVHNDQNPRELAVGNDRQHIKWRDNRGNDQGHVFYDQPN